MVRDGGYESWRVCIGVWVIEKANRQKEGDTKPAKDTKKGGDAERGRPSMRVK